MINVTNITKSFKNGKVSTIVNDNISFTVNAGEIVGLLGHNGAGKTTLINQLLGVIKPTSGEVTIFGCSIIDKPELGRSLCSIQPQSQLSLGELTPLRAVTIMGCMRGGDEKEINAEAMRLFEALDIVEWINKESSQLSGGIKRITAFCMAVINAPQIVILDEPTNDVDPVRRRYLWSEIKKLTLQGKGVIVVTHNVAEAENVVDRIIVLHKGKVIFNGTSNEIKGNNKNNLRFSILPSENYTKNNIPNWARGAFHFNEKIIFTVNKDRVNETIDWIRKQIGQSTIYDYSLSECTLEDAYIKLINDK